MADILKVAEKGRAAITACYDIAEDEIYQLYNVYINAERSKKYEALYNIIRVVYLAGFERALQKRRERESRQNG